MTDSPQKILWFATKGSGSNEALRIATLLSEIPGTLEMPYDKRQKRASLKRLLRIIDEQRANLIVMEGTGIAGGLACFYGKLRYGIPYVVSSGDAVGPFMRSRHPLLGLGFSIYERILCWAPAGFIGWTPYLCGRAMTFGAPRAVTAEGWDLGQASASDTSELTRDEWRDKLGIPKDDIVVGLVGSIDWNPNRKYCYGLDLVQAVRSLNGVGASVLIVGDGSGLERLRSEAGDLLNIKIFLPGPVAQSEVVSIMSAMDIGALPQSLDGVGSFRYTTKISEYVKAGLPMITNQIPAAYDLGVEWMWRLPGKGPWGTQYLRALALFLQMVTPDAVAEKRSSIALDPTLFSKDIQIQRVTRFIEDILTDGSPTS